jgi:hypothetical protein
LAVEQQEADEDPAEMVGRMEDAQIEVQVVIVLPSQYAPLMLHVLAQAEGEARFQPKLGECDFHADVARLQAMVEQQIRPQLQRFDELLRRRRTKDEAAADA